MCLLKKRENGFRQRAARPVPVGFRPGTSTLPEWASVFLLDVHSIISLRAPLRQPQEDTLPRGCCPPIGTATSPGICYFGLRSVRLRSATLDAKSGR